MLRGRSESGARMATKPVSPVGRSFEPLFTGGAILSHNSALELVRVPNDSTVQLLHWDGFSFSISASVEVAGRVYRPIVVDSNIQTALNLPSHAADYGSAVDLIG